MEISFKIVFREEAHIVTGDESEVFEDCVRRIFDFSSEFNCFRSNGNVLNNAMTLSSLQIENDDIFYLRLIDGSDVKVVQTESAIPVPIFEIKSKKEFNPTPLCDEIDISYYSESFHPSIETYLLMQPVAWQELREEIEWGQHSAKNRYEEGGILIGKVFQFKNKVYGVVEKIISSEVIGQATHISFSHEVWNKMLKKVDTFNERNQTDFIVLGWYHTHPNNITPVFSDTDYSTQRTHFSRYWQFALVLNPQKRTFNGYCGDSAKQCTVAFLQRVYDYSGRHESIMAGGTISKCERQIKTDYELLMRLQRLNSNLIGVTVVDRKNIPLARKYNVTFNTDVLISSSNSYDGYVVDKRVVVQIELVDGYPVNMLTVRALGEIPLHPYFDELGIYYPSQLNNARTMQEIVLELWSELNYRNTHGTNENITSERAARIISDKPQLSQRTFTKLKTE